MQNVYGITVSVLFSSPCLFLIFKVPASTDGNHWSSSKGRQPFYPLSFFKDKRDFFCFPRATACSPANHESVIELVPGPLAGASAARQTDPEQRLGECEVHTTSELLTCISFSQALKGTSEKESSCLTGPESPSLCRMQTRQMPMSSFLSL